MTIVKKEDISSIAWKVFNSLCRAIANVSNELNILVKLHAVVWRISECIINQYGGRANDTWQAGLFSPAIKPQ